MGCAFVQPEVVRLPLSGGEYIDVKKELTAKEQRHMFAGMIRTMTAGEKVELEPENVGRTKVSAYLVAWSFTDADGKPVPVTEGAIDSLKSWRYSEIVKRIDAHEAEIEAGQKNEQDGEINSVAISPSVN